VTPAEAQRVIESLRKGIPPNGFVRRFTVGRRSEINQLAARLSQGNSGALLLKANYGSGKTHLLRFIRETALQEGFAVSYIALDARSAVRFNRMDQIFGATARHVEVPSAPEQGPSVIFGAILKALTSSCDDVERRRCLDKLSNGGKWDHSDALKSPALFIALRAWITANMRDEADPQLTKEAEDWICAPWSYCSQRRWLYQRFVSGLRAYFRDSRPEWQFYQPATGVFDFRGGDYRQSWDALADLDRLAQFAGFKGLILLVDEFEDVIYNLKRINYQEAAFWNLFRLFDGWFPGLSFYAVTPGFVEKCKRRLFEKGKYDYDYTRFEELPAFEMSPLDVSDLEDLAMRIMDAHGVAYNWEPDFVMKRSQLKSLVGRVASVPVQDRARQTIIEVVKSLDRMLETVA